MPVSSRAAAGVPLSTGERAVVAILRFGAAGDVIRIAPALEAMAKAWPQARRLVVTHARLTPLLARCRVSIEPVPFAAGEDLASLAQRLRALGVTHVLDLHGSLRSRLLSWRLWPRPSAHVGKRSLAEWARVRLAHAPHRPPVTCAARQQKAIYALTGQQVALPPLALGVAADNARRATHPRARIGLSVGAAWATKRWPPKRWAQLACELHALGYQTLVFGSEAEAALVDAICQSAPHALACIGLTWEPFAQSLSGLDVFVCGDSGPLHLAMALQVPSVGLFFSTPDEAFDEVATHVVKGSVACRPCSFYGHASCPRGHGQCWEEVSVASVLEAIEKTYRTKTGYQGPCS